VWGVGCGVWGVGCGVWGVGCGVWGVGCGVWGVGCGVHREEAKVGVELELALVLRDEVALVLPACFRGLRFGGWGWIASQRTRLAERESV